MIALSSFRAKIPILVVQLFSSRGSCYYYQATRVALIQSQRHHCHLRSSASSLFFAFQPYNLSASTLIVVRGRTEQRCQIQRFTASNNFSNDKSTRKNNMADSTQSIGEEPKSSRDHCNQEMATSTRAATNDLSDMRKPYRDQDDGIEESQLPTRDPIKLFQNWFELVKASNTVYEPNAFSICTASKDGQPSSRMVLLKGFDEDGFRFFTHYSSQKGRNIAENPKVSMLFYWDSFNRQVRVEGIAERLPEESAVAYFKRRPQSSQIGAAISDQCSLIESREVLMERYDSLKAELGNEPPAKPSTWGGYLIRPERFEFWQGNTNRVHDRIIFRRPKPGESPDGKLSRPAESGWLIERMLP